MARIINVLLIEDNPADARLMREMFREEAMRDFTIEHADSLSEGLKLLTEGRHDAVILDLNLPDSTGLDTLLTLCNQRPKMPVVVMTGLADEETGLLAVHQGAQDYLVKGFVESGLLKGAIRFAIERKQILDEKADLVEQLKDALAKVKQLSGLLSICASCKRIRDDNGNWSQMESFITEHSEAVFSHGMCPDCKKRAYEEWEIFKKTNKG